MVSAQSGTASSTPPFIEAPVPASFVSRPPSAVLSPREEQPRLKRIASRLALVMTTYAANETRQAFGDRMRSSFGEAAAAEIAASLHRQGSWSRGRVVYAQLGGLLKDSASVMVVTEQTIGSPDGTSRQVRTLDVRLRKRGGDWHFTGLSSLGGDPVARETPLSPEAAMVLGNPLIELSDSARWDIEADRISPKLLTLMQRLATRTAYGVVALSSGHPWEIYGTDRQSDHTRGQAMDIYRIGDALVTDERGDDSHTRAVVEWLYEQPEVVRMGSPWALDGYGGRSFTDALHQDHLHVAVDAEAPDTLAHNEPPRP